MDLCDVWEPRPEDATISQCAVREESPYFDIMARYEALLTRFAHRLLPYYTEMVATSTPALVCSSLSKPSHLLLRPRDWLCSHTYRIQQPLFHLSPPWGQLADKGRHPFVQTGRASTSILPLCLQPYLYNTSLNASMTYSTSSSSLFSTCTQLPHTMFHIPQASNHLSSSTHMRSGVSTPAYLGMLSKTLEIQRPQTVEHPGKYHFQQRSCELLASICRGNPIQTRLSALEPWCWGISTCRQIPRQIDARGILPDCRNWWGR